MTQIQIFLKQSPSRRPTSNIKRIETTSGGSVGTCAGTGRRPTSNIKRIETNIVITGAVKNTIESETNIQYKKD